jgi:hypothetical protein
LGPKGPQNKKPHFLQKKMRFDHPKDESTAHSPLFQRKVLMATWQAGFLTCVSASAPPFPNCSFSGLLKQTPRLQWRDRPGLAPGSLLSFNLHRLKAPGTILIQLLILLSYSQQKYNHKLTKAISSPREGSRPAYPSFAVRGILAALAGTAGHKNKCDKNTPK